MEQAPSWLFRRMTHVTSNLHRHLIYPSFASLILEKLLKRNAQRCWQAKLAGQMMVLTLTLRMQQSVLILTGFQKKRVSKRLQAGSNRTGLANLLSTINCAIGYSAVKDIVASRSQLFIGKMAK